MYRTLFCVNIVPRAHGGRLWSGLAALSLRFATQEDTMNIVLHTFAERLKSRQSAGESLVYNNNIAVDSSIPCTALYHTNIRSEHRK